jgi:uncharacterized membrane protein
VNRYVVLYLATLIVLIPIDFLFLGTVAKGFSLRRSATCWARSGSRRRYATFGLTSLSLLNHWTWSVVMVDVSWGAFVTAVSSTTGLMIANWIAPRI